MTQTRTASDKKLRRKTRDQLSVELRRSILAGRLPPGSKLKQQHLAQEHDVSLGVVREALLELKAIGLVEFVRDAGVTVTDLDASLYIEAFEVREMLEGLAARLCCERASRRDLRELRQLAEQMYEMILEGGREEEQTSLDRKFHRRIVEIAGNRMLERVAQSYRVLGPLPQLLPRGNDLAHDEHLAILDAIEHDRADDAERLMREHIKANRLLLAEEISAGRFTLPWESSK